MRMRMRRLWRQVWPSEAFSRRGGRMCAQIRLVLRIGEGELGREGNV